MFKITILCLFLSGFHENHCISTTHHDKPENSTISKMATKMSQEVPSERQKRLLPYVTYYNKPKYTPFLDSNAIPGPFIPIVKPRTQYEVNKEPNFATIYDTLVQLKHAQQDLNQVYRNPINYVPVRYYQQKENDDTVVETYTPTMIDVESHRQQKPQTYEIVRAKEIKNEQYRPVKVYFEEKKPVIYETVSPPQEYNSHENLQEYPEKNQNHKSVIYETVSPPQQYNSHENIQDYSEKNQNQFEQEKDEYRKPYEPVQYVTEKPYEYYSTTNTIPRENTNILAKILKQLQNSNTLPHTFTPHNIDNSIRTLVKILNGLRKQQGLKTKPIVVLDEEQTEKPPEDDKIYTQVFPANTIDGGTPGRPGIDYPALSTIPQTDFNCKTQRYKGFFGDPHTNCQVWHYCDLNGGQASFLCPNGTIFSQVALTCDWWYNVKCASTPQLYVLNERLYKYILPFAPKFPEDYSGPLVDRYLALKFQEMEEKMKKQKKKKQESEEDEKDDDSDHLQSIQNEKEKSSQEL